MSDISQETKGRPSLTRRVWNGGLKGDKVILIVAFLLMLVSLIAVPSSAPLLAQEIGVERIEIMTSQLTVVMLGAVIILFFYIFGGKRLYRFIGRFGFALSLAMLLILVLDLDLGFAKAGSFNGAQRVIVILGKQLHVYEFVKVLMVLYTAWALDSYKSGTFRMSKWLASLSPKLAFFDTLIGEKTLYIYTPLMLILGLVLTGSNSSALFLAFILILLIIIGGVDLKSIVSIGLALLLVGGLLLGAHKAGILTINRFDTARERIANDEKALIDTLIMYRPGGDSYDPVKFEETRDKLRQSVSAQLAIKEGGILGKGVGKSTQKYVVPVIFGDYMFSFIIEETGLIGAAIILLLYFSVLARGALLSKRCEDYFEKVLIAGLSILVTCQAYMHMMVNVHFPFVPQTGQTLPLVSHGTTSFIVFSAVFGMILSISRRHPEAAQMEDENHIQEGMTET